MQEVQLFEVFSNQISSIIANREYLPPEDMVALQVALVNLALKCYPDRIDYIDKVMLSSVEVRTESICAESCFFQIEFKILYYLMCLYF